MTNHKSVLLARRIGVAPPLLLLAFLLPPPHSGGATIAGIPSLCLFHNLTGLPCPGCGITRSVVSCAHGEWVQAVWYHPLGPLTFALLFLMTISRVPPLYQRFAIPPRLVNSGAVAAVTLLLAIWAARLSGVLPSPP